MPENAIERLDELIEAMLAGRRAEPVVDADLAMLAAVASDLRDLPRREFKSELRKKLVPQETTMTTTIVTTTMTRTGVRPGFTAMTPYFVVNGADKFIEFMQKSFGGELLGRYPRPDGTVQHAEVRIGDSMVELGDAADRYPAITMGIHLYVDDVDAVYASAVGAGAKTLQPLTDQVYGDREAAIEDAFGNHWYLATHQATGNRPPGFHAVTPFLHPRGADDLIEFLKTVFEADVLERDAAPNGTVAHATVRIGDAVLEMGEAHGQWQPLLAAIHLYVDDADSFFERALEAGATTLYAVADQPYGERSGGVVDPFGNQWFVATSK